MGLAVVASLAGEPWGKADGGAKAPTAPAAASGEVVLNGTLASGDQRLNSGEWYDTYEFDGRAGSRVSVRLVSTAFDPYLGLHSDVIETVENDDAATGEGSLIETTVPRDGRFKVIVTSYKPGEVGAYTLRVSGLTAVGAAPVAPPPPKPPPGPAAVRQDGALAASDPKLSSGEYYDRWVFFGKPGSSVTVRVTSAAFDTYVGFSGPGLNTMENDDAATGEGALISTTLPQDGTFTVTVTSYKPGESGAYVLETTGFSGPGKPEGGAAPAPAPAPAANDVVLGRQIGAAMDAWRTDFAGHIGAKRASTVVTSYATDLAFDGAKEVELMRTLSPKHVLVATYGEYADAAAAFSAYDALVARVQAAPFGFPVVYNSIVHDNLRTTYWLPLPTGAGAAYAGALVEVEVIKGFAVGPDLSMRDNWMLLLRVTSAPTDD